MRTVRNHKLTFGILAVALLAVGLLAMPVWSHSSDGATLTVYDDIGRMATGLVKFAAEGTEDCVVTIGAVTYTEEHVATDVTVGEWDNGGAASNSVTNLVAAINGDTRNAGGNSYAAVQSTDGTVVFITALAIGTSGNVTVSADQAEPSVKENLIGGAAAAVKQTVTVMHTVTSQEGTSVEVIVPLPFDATYFSWQIYDSSGGFYATEITDRGTVTAAAGAVTAYFTLDTNGATHIQAGDILRLVATD